MLSPTFVRATIGKGGVKLEAHGFAGDGCKQAITHLTSQLKNATVGQMEPTADLYRTDEQVKELDG